MKEESPQNRIKISRKKGYPNSFIIWSSNEFFEDKKEVIFEPDEYGITFRVPSIEDEHGHRNVYSNGLAGYIVSVNDINLPTGYFNIDHDETTEDEIYFDYNTENENECTCSNNYSEHFCRYKTEIEDNLEMCKCCPCCSKECESNI